MTDQATSQPTTLIKQIRVTKNGVKHEMEIRVDFEGVSKSQLLNWAFADRIIASQRVLRECDGESLTEFSANGYKVHALSAGTKPVTLKESLDSMKQLLASLPADKRAEMMENLMDGI